MTGVTGPDPQRRRWLAVAALLAAGCAGPGEKSTEKDQGDRLWPMPPEQPRFAFELDLRTALDVFEDNEDSRRRRLLSNETLYAERLFEKPVAVAARQGRIYVADSVRRHIVVLDVPRRRAFVMGLRDPGKLAKPVAMALDRQGHLYVADASLRKVMVYDGLGLFLRTVGLPDDFKRPTGVAVDASGERVYVVDRSDNDSDDHRVLAFSGAGERLRDIGRRGQAPGEFNIPVQAAVAPDGTLWVLDAGNFRVQAFDPEGRFLRAFGQAGNSFGQFARPRGLACDSEGQLYVTDGAFGNVQVFNPRGELLITLGRSSRLDLPGRYGLPYGVAVDETGRVYVVDQLFNKVEVLRRLSEAEGLRLVQQAQRRN